jgi:hypothetical protein
MAPSHQHLQTAQQHLTCVGTKKDQARKAFIQTDRNSDKMFIMPNGAAKRATAMDELHHDVCAPAKDVHIVPAIKRDSLLSMSKFVDANNIAIFDKDEVNIYDANNTVVTVTRAAILRGWQCKQTKLWQVPLVKDMPNNNTQTVLCDCPPSEFLPEEPPPPEAINNVYKLKTQA